MIRQTLLIASTCLVLAGCGGETEESVTPQQRIDRCLQEQPDATQSDCEQWEADGELRDDGTHEGHDAS
jgi:outer membrane biogenesis lipoprotein LolB